MKLCIKQHTCKQKTNEKRILRQFRGIMFEAEALVLTSSTFDVYFFVLSQAVRLKISQRRASLKYLRTVRTTRSRA